MKVGDYVRFDYHRVSVPIQIAKITEKYDTIMSENDSICYSTDIGLVIDETNLVKEPSPNIIDLIEVGDYVNGYLIDYIDSERRYLRSERPYREDSTMYKDLIEKGRNYNQSLHFFAEDIKSIVTKEQFESIKYEVK